MKTYEPEFIDKIKESKSISEACSYILAYFDGRDIPFIREFVEKLLELTYTGIVKIVSNQAQRHNIQERFDGLAVLQEDNRRLYVLKNPLTNNDWIELDIGDRFPDFVNNANKFLKVNNSSTGLEYVSINYINNEIRARNKFRYEQLIPVSVWNINHNLNTYPSVTIVDSSGKIVFGEIKYLDSNTVVVYFSSSFSGVAYLN